MNIFLDVFGLKGRCKTSDNISLSVYQKLGEIPFDVFSDNRLKDVFHLFLKIAGVAVFDIGRRIFFKEGEEGLCFFSVNVNLCKSLKLGSEIDFAE